MKNCFFIVSVVYSFAVLSTLKFRICLSRYPTLKTIHVNVKYYYVFFVYFLLDHSYCVIVQIELKIENRMALNWFYSFFCVRMGRLMVEISNFIVWWH